MSTEILSLTEELDWLVSRGATLDRLGRAPTLVRLAKVTGDTRSKGLVVREFLRTELGLLEAPVEFKGREHPVEVARQAWVINLDLRDTGFDVTYRREQVMDLLGYWNRTCEWWRKGPEFEFLYLLAERIIAGNS